MTTYVDPTLGTDTGQGGPLDQGLKQISNPELVSVWECAPFKKLLLSMPSCVH